MWFLLAGFGTGIIGGLFGVGGGEFFIPILIYVFGFSQHQAQGTSLAVLLPPIGLLAALRYYRAGHVDFGVATLLALGFFFGASLGAVLGTRIQADVLRRLFGAFLLLVALHMIFRRHGNAGRGQATAQARSSTSSRMVRTTDTTIDPRHPSRLEKKMNGTPARSQKQRQLRGSTVEAD